MSSFDIAWIGFGLYFAVVEGYALWLNTVENKSENKVRRTLSSVFWTLGGTTTYTKSSFWIWIRRGILGMFCLWFTVHMMSGGTIV